MAKKPQVVWIALSAKGHPAPFIGYAFERKMLARQYLDTFGHSLASAGYRLVKAQLVFSVEGE